MYQFDFFLPCAKGVQTLLRRECEAFPVEIRQETGSGLAIACDIPTAYRLCVYSRLANRVLLHLGTLEAGTADAFYLDALRFNWDWHFRETNTLLIHAHGQNQALRNSHFACLKLKDAICDHFLGKTEVRPSIDKIDPDIQLHIYLKRDKAEIYLDFSGQGLHRRSYRGRKAKAPLKETLAATLLDAAGWQRLASEGASFCDPMCGSGTIAIEAAMVAYQMAPSTLRKTFGFCHWKRFEPTTFDAIRAEAAERFESGLAKYTGEIYASDKQGFAVKETSLSLRRLGLHEKVQVQHAPLDTFDWPYAARGLLLTNPPYGHRMGSASELHAIYTTLRRLIAGKPDGWRVGIFSADRKGLDSLGVKPGERHYFYNGRLQSQLLIFD